MIPYLKSTSFLIEFEMERQQLHVKCGFRAAYKYLS